MPWLCELVYFYFDNQLLDKIGMKFMLSKTNKKKNTVTDYFWYWSETILIDNPFSIITGLYQVTKVEIYNSSHRGMRLMVSQNFWTDRKRKGSSVL